MKQLYFFLTFLFLSTIGFAQQIMFSKVLPPWLAGTFSASETNENGYLWVGERGLIIKLDSVGNKVWGKRISNYNFYSINKTKDGGFILCGTYRPQSSPLINICVVKLNADGDTLWSKALTHSSDCFVASCRQTSDGGYIVGGYITDSVGGKNISVFKLNPSGSLVWNTTLDGGNEDICMIVKQFPDGGYGIFGTTKRDSLYPPLAFFSRLSSSGDVEWSKTYLSYAKALDFEIDNNAIVCLNTSYQILKIDLSGDLIWFKKLNGYDDSYLFSGSKHIIRLSDKGYLLSRPSERGHSSLTRTDSLGNPIWSKSPLLVTKYIMQTKDKGLLLVGTGQFPPSIAEKNTFITEEAGIIKTDSTGLSTKCITGDNLPSLTSLTTTVTNVMFKKSSLGILQNLRPTINSIQEMVEDRCITISFGITENSTQESILTYPNPFSSNLRLEFQDGNVTIFTIRNMLGQVVLEKTNIQEKSFLLDTKKFIPGMYLLQCSTKEGERITKKLIRQ